MRKFSIVALLFACVGDNASSDAGAQGEEGGPCFANGTCNAGLVCVVPNKCERPDADAGVTPDTSPPQDVISEPVVDSSPTPDASSDASDGGGGCPTTGLLAWWKADGDGTDVQGFLPLSAKGSVNYTNAHSNLGFLLDGTSYLQGSGTNAQLPGLSAITIEGWINPTNLNNAGVIFSRRASTAAKGFMFYLGGGKLNFAGNGSSISANTTLAVSTSHHVAVTSDGVTVKFYVDGEADGSGGGAAIMDDAVDALVGAAWASTSTQMFQFVGWIDELAIYSKALTATQISSLKNGSSKCN